MLTGKIALVTGAGRGIGREIAALMARYGAFVYINYSGSEEKARELKKELLQEGLGADICRCDVTDYEAVKAMVDRIGEERGRLDILVNNAGITKDTLAMKMTEEDFDSVIRVNLKGAFHCMKHGCRMMLRQRYGRMINISSVVGLHGNPGQLNYAASKAGLIGMTKTMAKELGSRGITVNAIAPGFIETEMTDVLPDRIKEETKRNIPMGMFGSCLDVAETAAFLASDRARYITGQVIGVDGGMGI